MAGSLLPETVSLDQLTHVIAQATAPAFLLGAVAGFISILVMRLNRMVDRIRALDAIGKDDVRLAHLTSDIPRLRRHARLLNRAIFFAISTAITVTFLILISFIGALVSLPHERYVGALFILSCTQFCISLGIFAFEILLGLPAPEFHG